jgi:hypothetical protein
LDPLKGGHLAWSKVKWLGKSWELELVLEKAQLWVALLVTMLEPMLVQTLVVLMGKQMEQ